MKRISVVVFCFLLLSMFSACVVGIGEYRVVDLGTINNADAYCTAINNAGQAVAYAMYQKPVMWESDGTRVVLGSLPGMLYTRVSDINDLGQVTGSGVNEYMGYSNGCVWSAATGMVAIGTLPGYTYATPNGLNDVGVIVGSANNPFPANSAHRAFMRMPDGSMEDMGVTPGYAYSTAGDINNVGQVVGSGAGTDFKWNACIWQRDAGWQRMPTLPKATRSVARAINDSGWAAGESEYGAGSYTKAVLWDPQGNITSIGALSGTSGAGAYDINDAGQVVGVSGGRAFFWSTETGMFELPPLAEYRYTYAQAYDLNDSGVAVGISRSADGKIHAVKWVPNILDVAVDIKPGDDANMVNLKSNGVLPVAILGTDTFDVSTVDLASITLAGARVKARKNGTMMSSFEDVNADGIIDLVLHFGTQDLVVQASEPSMMLNGKLTDGMNIRGTGTIRCVGG